MDRQSTLRSSFVLKLALLFLGFAIFNWALQARLPSFANHTGPCTAPAKLCADSQGARTRATLRSQSNPEGLWNKFVSTVLFAPWRPQAAAPPVDNRAELALFDPNRLDLQGIFLLDRPPPSFS